MEQSATLQNLLYSTRDFLQDLLKNDLFPYRAPGQLTSAVISERPMNFFLQSPPVVEDEQAQVPFILLQLIAGVDEWSDSKAKGTTTVTIRIVIELYDPDYTEGKLRLIGLIDRMRHAFRQAGMVGGLFRLTDPFEYLIYPDDTDSYHVAELSTNWIMPYVYRDVPELRGDPVVNNFLHPDVKGGVPNGKKESGSDYGRRS